MQADPITYMLKELSRASGWNRIGHEIHGKAIEIASEIMNDSTLDPAVRLKAINALQASTALGIRAVDSLTRLVEVQVLNNRIGELERIVQESNPQNTLPPLPDYDLPFD